MYENLISALRETRERIKNIPNMVMYVPPYQLSAAADVIEELTAINERQLLEIAVLSKPRWIPVTEQLPNESKAVLVVAVNDFHEDDRWVAVDWIYCGEWQQHSIVTYWMPLPELPKEEI